MGVSGALGTFTKGMGSVLSFPLFTRKNKYFNRNRKGILLSTSEDEWSICVGHGVFVLACYVAWQVFTKYADLPLSEQAEIFASLIVAGPVGGALAALGLGPKDGAVWFKSFYHKIQDLPGLVGGLTDGFV